MFNLKLNYKKLLFSFFLYLFDAIGDGIFSRNEMKSIH